MDSNDNLNQQNKILNAGFDEEDEDENEFNWLSKNNDKILNQKDNESKDNFNPISLLQKEPISNKKNINEENNLIEEMQKLNISNKPKTNISKDLVFNYYFGAGNNNNENKHSTLLKNNNENNILMNNNTIQGSRFMGMNTMNSNLNKEDFFNNNNNEISGNDFRNMNNFNNEKINFNNNTNKNLILTQPYIPKKNRFENPNPNFQNQNFQNINFQNQNLQNINIPSNNEIIPGKFFVIKSIDEANIIRSINFKIWCSTIKGNQKLQKAFKESEKKYPIYLFFSVNGSGKFMGLAQMASEVEYRVNFNYWSQNDKWKGFFFVNWIYIKDIPNRIFRQITNEYNDNKPVTSSRDTQEIFTSAGIKMLKIFKDYPQESSIFDTMSLDEKLMIYQQKNNSNQNRQINQMENLNNLNNFNNMNMGMYNNNFGNGNIMNMNMMNNNNMNFNKMNLNPQQQMMMMMQQRYQQQQRFINNNTNNKNIQDNNF